MPTGHCHEPGAAADGEVTEPEGLLTDEETEARRTGGAGGGELWLSIPMGGSRPALPAVLTLQPSRARLTHTSSQASSHTHIRRLEEAGRLPRLC